MEKLLSKREFVINSLIDNAYLSSGQICGCFFSGMVFSENIDGCPSIALTFSSNIRELFPVSACFRLTGCHNINTKFINCEKKTKKIARQMKLSYFCQLKTGLKNYCKCITGLIINVSTFFRTGHPINR